MGGYTTCLLQVQGMWERIRITRRRKPRRFPCECGGNLQHAIATPPTSDKTPKSSEKSSKGIFE